MQTRTPRASVRRVLAGFLGAAAIGLASPALCSPPDVATLEQFRRNPMSFFFLFITAYLVQCGPGVLLGAAGFSPA